MVLVVFFSHTLLWLRIGVGVLDWLSFACATTGWVVSLQGVDPGTKHVIGDVWIVEEVGHVLEPVGFFPFTIPGRVTNSPAVCAESRYSWVRELHSFTPDG